MNNIKNLMDVVFSEDLATSKELFNNLMAEKLASRIDETKQSIFISPESESSEYNLE